MNSHPVGASLLAIDPRLPHEVHFLPAALALQDAPVHRVRELTAAKKAAENQQNSVIAQTRRAMLDLQHESRLTAPVAGAVVSISNDAIEDERLGWCTARGFN